jgi:hypothetical protein
MPTLKEPISLVMRPLQCFYCESVAKGQSLINHHEGIYVCDEHNKDGLRDCLAYLNRNKMIRIGDALSSPIIQPFLRALQSFFSIRRSDGSIESGWKIHLSFFNPYVYIQQINNKWCVPGVKYGDNGNHIYGPVPLIGFKEAELRLPGITDEMIDAALSRIEEGFYQDAVDAQKDLVNQGSTIETLGDSPSSGIVTADVETSSGDIATCRILLPTH